jgi:hypothetical protein
MLCWTGFKHPAAKRLAALPCIGAAVPAQHCFNRLLAFGAGVRCVGPR